jgi:hypothetical protein
MKVAKYLLILLVLTFNNSVSAGGDNLCSFLYSRTNILRKFQKFEGIYKFLNVTASLYINQVLLETESTVPEIVFQVTQNITQVQTVFGEAGLSISLDSFQPAATLFIVTNYLQPLKRDQKFGEVKFIIEQGSILYEKVESAIFTSIANMLNVSVAEILELFYKQSAASVKILYPLSCITEDLKHLHDLKSSVLLELNNYANVFKSLILNKIG